MENLPLEIYEAIFDHLHLKDVARLRAVCKKLQSVVKEYRIRELHLGYYAYKEGTFQIGPIFRPRNMKAVVPGEEMSFKRSWRFHFLHAGPAPLLKQLKDYQKTNVDLQCSAANIFLRSDLFNVQYLKILTCEFPENGIRCAEEINQFTKLQRLEIFFNTRKELRVNLCLPELQILIIRDCSRKTLEIDAPKCKGFHCSREDKSTFKFSNPSSVRYLSLDWFDERVCVFENIEHLEISHSHYLIHESFHSAFSLLKTLRMLICQSAEEIVQFMNTVGKRHVQLFVYGIRLVTGNELGDCHYFRGYYFRDQRQDVFHSFSSLDAFSTERFEVLIDNYEKLNGELNFVRHMVFSERVARLFELDPRKFVGFFSNIAMFSSRIAIDKPELFFSLLSHYSRLQCLEIVDSGLEQQWFDRLACFKGLRALIIEEEKKINFSFLNKLPKIDNLKTNCDLDFNEEIRLDQWKRQFNFMIRFYSRTSQFSILVMDGNAYSLSINGNYLGEFPNPKALVKRINTEKDRTMNAGNALGRTEVRSSNCSLS